jgi:hypothetical protein
MDRPAKHNIIETQINASRAYAVVKQEQCLQLQDFASTSIHAPPQVLAWTDKCRLALKHLLDCSYSYCMASITHGYVLNSQSNTNKQKGRSPTKVQDRIQAFDTRDKQIHRLVSLSCKGPGFMHSAPTSTRANSTFHTLAWCCHRQYSPFAWLAVYEWPR